MEKNYSKHKFFQWKIKGRLEHLGVLGVMGETARLNCLLCHSRHIVICALFYMVPIYLCLFLFFWGLLSFSIFSAVPWTASLYLLGVK